MDKSGIMDIEFAYRKNKKLTVPYIVENTFVEVNTRMMSHTNNRAFLIIDMSAPQIHQSPTADEYNHQSFIDEMNSMVSRGVYTELFLLNEPTDTPFENEMAKQALQYENLIVKYINHEMKDMFKVKGTLKDENNFQNIQFAFYDEKAFVCGFSNIGNDFPRYYSLNDKSDIKATNQYINHLKMTM